MARLFDDASSQYLVVSSTPITAAPLTISCWFNSDEALAWQAFAYIGDSAGNTDYHYLTVNSGTVRMFSYDGTAGQAISTSSYSANTWHHACGVVAAADDRAVYLDGGSKGTDAISVTPAGIDRITVGVRGTETLDRYMSGRIAEVGIWNVALTDSEVASLAAGVPPTLVRPASLAIYAPLLRTDQDLVGGYDMTPTNGPTWADHPPDVIPPWYRKRGYYIAASAVSASASVSPSISPSASESPSVSPSESASESASESPSPSPGTTADVVWGHDTGVVEDNVRDFNGNWTGTGTIENPGVADTERLALESGEYMISEIVDTGAETVQLLQNTYAAGDDVTMEYRHGATPNACAAAAWNNYVAPFLSAGYVQIRLTSTL